MLSPENHIYYDIPLMEGGDVMEKVLLFFIIAIPVICLVIKSKNIYTEEFELNILKGQLKIKNKEKSLDDSGKPSKLIKK